MSRLAPIVLSLLAFAIASCGDDDDGGDNNAPSRAEFAQRANQICRQAEQALENLGENAETPQDIVDTVDQVIEETTDAVDQLADLDRPEGEAGQAAEEFVEATRQDIENRAIPALEELREAIESADQQAITDAATRLREVEGSESDRAAREIGADDCS